MTTRLSFPGGFVGAGELASCVGCAGGMASKLSVAVALVVEPYGLDTTTEYPPEFVIVTEFKVKVAFVALGMFKLLSCHW